MPTFARKSANVKRTAVSPAPGAAMAKTKDQGSKRTADEPVIIEPGELSPDIVESTFAAWSRMKARRTRVQVTVTQTGPKSFNHGAGEGFKAGLANMQVGDALGTTSMAFKDRVLSQIATVFSESTVQRSEQGINMALAALDGAKPENELEAMLIAQMVVSHDAAMNCLAQVGKGGFVNQAEVFGSLAVKLLRTYTAQIEALAKIRRKGEQTVKVVHVYPGGQAVVGDIHNHPQGEGLAVKIEERPHGTGELTAGAALPCPYPQENGVPVASDAERPLPPSRRTIARRQARKSKCPEARILEQPSN